MTSGNVRANPAEIRKFTAMLKRFNQDLSNNTRVLHGQFNNLGETWQDQQHQKFAQEFEQLVVVLNKFIQSSDAQIPLLNRSAELLEEFNRVH